MYYLEFSWYLQSLWKLGEKCLTDSCKNTAHNFSVFSPDWIIFHPIQTALHSLQTRIAMSTHNAGCYWEIFVNFLLYLFSPWRHWHADFESKFLHTNHLIFIKRWTCYSKSNDYLESFPKLKKKKLKLNILESKLQEV